MPYLLIEAYDETLTSIARGPLIEYTQNAG